MSDILEAYMKKSEPLRSKTREELSLMNINAKIQYDQTQSHIKFLKDISPLLLWLTCIIVVIGILQQSIFLVLTSFLPVVIVILMHIYATIFAKKGLKELELVHVIEYEIDRRKIMEL